MVLRLVPYQIQAAIGAGRHGNKRVWTIPARATADCPRPISCGAAGNPSGVEAEWSGVLRTVRAGMLAVPSRCAARLPHLTAHEVAEIDAEVRAALTRLSTNQ